MVLFLTISEYNKLRKAQSKEINYFVPFKFQAFYDFNFPSIDRLEIYNHYNGDKTIIKVYCQRSVENGKPYLFIRYNDLPLYLKVEVDRLNAVSRYTNEPKKCYINRFVYVLATNTPIPKDYHVHHADDNSLNNDITNLIALHKTEHKKLHQNRISIFDIVLTLDDDIKPIRKKQAKHYTDSKENAIIELIKQGKSNRYIIRTLKTHFNTIKQIRHKLKENFTTSETPNNSKSENSENVTFKPIVSFNKILGKCFKNDMCRPILSFFNTS